MSRKPGRRRYMVGETIQLREDVTPIGFKTPLPKGLCGEVVEVDEGRDVALPYHVDFTGVGKIWISGSTKVDVIEE